VCNIGHFDNEIDTLSMRDAWAWEEVKPQVHKIYRATPAGEAPDTASANYLLLLSEGRLVNLGNATGHPSRIMDGSFANQVLAQIHLYEVGFGRLPADEKLRNLSVQVLPKSLDEEVAQYMVEGFGGTLTRMTAEQSDYLGVPVEGPYKPTEYRY
jgi:adenosylhomocysteinase